MSGLNDAGTALDHTHHGHTQAPAHRWGRIQWAVVYVIGLVLVTGLLVIFVPGGGQLGLVVLLGGLMVLHHLPGGGHQHGS